MPSKLESTLWDLVQDQKYSQVLDLIKNNPGEDLINSKISSGRNLPTHLVITTMGLGKNLPKNLILYVLTHPKMDWDYVNMNVTTTNSLLQAVLYHGDFSIIEALKEEKGFIENNGKLTYDIASKLLKEANRTLEFRIKKQKPQKEIDAAKENVAKSTHLVALIRDITILYAIKTDSTSLMDAMERSGSDPLDKLGDFGGKKLPTILISRQQSTPNLDEWREKRLERICEEKLDDSVLVEKVKRLRFFEQQMNAAQVQHDAKNKEIMEDLHKGRMDRLERAVQIIAKK